MSAIAGGQELLVLVGRALVVPAFGVKVTIEELLERSLCAAYRHDFTAWRWREDRYGLTRHCKRCPVEETLPATSIEAPSR